MIKYFLIGVIFLIIILLTFDLIISTKNNIDKYNQKVEKVFNNN